MKVKKMSFIGGEDGAEPNSITVSMTITEAAWIAKVAGEQRGESPHVAIYATLIGDVFNRYWDDGLDDFLLVNPVETPPVIYDTAR